MSRRASPAMKKDDILELFYWFLCSFTTLFLRLKCCNCLKCSVRQAGAKVL